MPVPRRYAGLKVETRLIRSRGWDPAKAPKIGTPADVAAIARKLVDSDRERVLVLYLNVQNQVIGVQQLAVGALSAAMVPVDAVLRAALLADAAGIILVHNHPSGTPTPSAADRQIHNRLATAAKHVDLTLLDSVVVANGAYVSLAERSRGAGAGWSANRPMRYPLLKGLARPSTTEEGRESFAAALKRYIAAGYKAPEAMRATWHDVHIGRVSRPVTAAQHYQRWASGTRNLRALTSGAIVLASPSGRMSGAALHRAQERIRRRARRDRRDESPAVRGLPRQRTARPDRVHALTVPEQHQLRIARQTLRMHPAMARVMGGPTPSEARRIIRILHGNPRGGTELGEAAMMIAARAAAEYLRRHNLEADPTALLETLRSWVKIKLPEALRAARTALEARMPQAAEQTFAASMALAGIEAAKEASRPRGNPYRRMGAAAFLRGLPRGSRLVKVNRQRSRGRARRETAEELPYSPARGITHSLISEDYWRAMQRADYYRWSASRGFVGRDPLTGREERTPAHRRAATACDKAQARVWLDQAAKLRESMRGADPLARRHPTGNPRTARFCSEILQPKGRYDARSFRTVIARGHRVTVGCPRSHYAAHGAGRCRHPVEAQRILHPAGEGRCPYGGPRRTRRNLPGRRARLTTFYDRIHRIYGEKGRKSRAQRPGPYTHGFTSGPSARGVDRGGWYRLRRGQVVLGGRRPIYAQLPGGA
jgi:hypothetical protein